MVWIIVHVSPFLPRQHHVWQASMPTCLNSQSHSSQRPFWVMLLFRSSSLKLASQSSIQVWSHNSTRTVHPQHNAPEGTFLPIIRGIFYSSLFLSIVLSRMCNAQRRVVD